MSNVLDFHPNWVSPPGDTILDIITARSIDIADFAVSMALSQDRVNRMLGGELSIDKGIAEKLTLTLGGSVQFWLSREDNFRTNLSRLEQSWHKALPLRDLIKMGWLTKQDASIEGCFNFFRVSNLSQWNRKYSELSHQVAFRKSTTFTGKLGAIAAWLNMGEIIASQTESRLWDKKALLDSILMLRNLTMERRIVKFLPNLKQICSNCGVTLVILKTPPGCPISGATKFLDNGKPIILLSFRYLSDDQFWFTFFHEVGHLILHERTLNLETKGDPRNFTDKREIEANEFAEESLIPEEYRIRLMSLSLDKFSIVRFAKEVGVSTGVVVGQLQHMGRTKFNYFNQLKQRYKWDEIDNILG